MLKAYIVPTGNLYIELTCEETRRRLQDTLDIAGFWEALSNAFKTHVSKGHYTPVNPAEGKPYIGITNNPCIAESVYQEVDGSVVISGRLWHYQNHGVNNCPVRDLIETGKTTFQRV